MTAPDEHTKIAKRCAAAVALYRTATLDEAFLREAEIAIARALDEACQEAWEARDSAQSARDTASTDLATAVDLLRGGDCFEHADNCCHEWCDGCVSGRKTARAVIDFLAEQEAKP